MSQVWVPQWKCEKGQEPLLELLPFSQVSSDNYRIWRS